MNYRVSKRFYDADGNHIWTSNVYKTYNLRCAILEAERSVGMWGNSVWNIDDYAHPQSSANRGSGLARSIALLATNISIKDEKGRFVPWRNI